MRKTFPLKSLAVAASLAGALSAHAEVRTLDFENVFGGQPSCDTCLIDGAYGDPPGYADTGLSFKRWILFDVENGIFGNNAATAFPLALNSGKFVASNFGGNTAELHSTTPFSMVSAYMSSGSRDGLTFNVIGWRNGVQMYSDEVVLNTDERTFIRFNNNDVDFVEFAIDYEKGETNPFYVAQAFSWAMDDLKVNITPVPEPEQYALLGAGLAVLAWRRRASRSQP